MSDDQHKKELLEIYHRKLYLLQQQSAKLGIYTPPHIIMEIDEVITKISAINLEQQRVILTDKQNNVLYLDPNTVKVLLLKIRNAKRDIQLWFDLQEVPALLKQEWLISVNDISNDLARRIVKEVILPITKEWRNGSIDTLREASSKMDQRCATWVREDNATSVIESSVKRWRDTVNLKINNKIQETLRLQEIQDGIHQISMDKKTIIIGDSVSMDLRSVAYTDYLSLAGASVITVGGLGSLLLGSAILITSPLLALLLIFIVPVLILGGADLVTNILFNKRVPIALRNTFSDEHLEQKLMEHVNVISEQLSANLKSQISEADINQMSAVLKQVVMEQFDLIEIAAIP